MNQEQVIDGLQFPEGPVAMADGSVVLVEMRRRHSHACDPGRTARDPRRVGRWA